MANDIGAADVAPLLPFGFSPRRGVSRASDAYLSFVRAVFITSACRRRFVTVRCG
jgi:hypothetical protein